MDCLSYDYDCGDDDDDYAVDDTSCYTWREFFLSKISNVDKKFFDFVAVHLTEIFLWKLIFVILFSH